MRAVPQAKLTPKLARRANQPQGTESVSISSLLVCYHQEITSLAAVTLSMRAKSVRLVTEKTNTFSTPDLFPFEHD